MQTSEIVGLSMITLSPFLSQIELLIFSFLNFIFSYVYIVTYGSSPSAIYTIIVIIIKFSHIKRANTALQSSLSQEKKVMSIFILYHDP